MSCCAGGNELSVCIKLREFLDQLRNCYLGNTDCRVLTCAHCRTVTTYRETVQDRPLRISNAFTDSPTAFVASYLARTFVFAPSCKLSYFLPTQCVLCVLGYFFIEQKPNGFYNRQCVFTARYGLNLQVIQVKILVFLFKGLYIVSKTESFCKTQKYVHCKKS